MCVDLCGGTRQRSHARRAAADGSAQLSLRSGSGRNARRPCRARRPAEGDPRKPRLHGRRRLERHRAELAPRRGRPGRSGRGSHPHRRHRQGAVDSARPRSRRRPPDRYARAEAGAQAAPHRRRARAQRSGDVELHLRGRGCAVRRRGVEPRQSDQRGHEGHAAFIAPRPARRGRAQCEARRERRAAVRDRPALSRRQGTADARRGACGRSFGARLAGRQGPALRSVRRQGRGAGAARSRGRAGVEPAGDGPRFPLGG